MNFLSSKSTFKLDAHKCGECTGSGRVLSGSWIWPKYGVKIRKTTNILTGSRIWLLPGKWDSPNLGMGCRIFRLFVGNSGNRHNPNKLSSGQSRMCLLSNQGIECSWLILKFHIENLSREFFFSLQMPEMSTWYSSIPVQLLTPCSIGSVAQCRQSLQGFKFTVIFLPLMSLVLVPEARRSTKRNSMFR